MAAASFSSTVGSGGFTTALGRWTKVVRQANLTPDRGRVHGLRLGFW